MRQKIQASMNISAGKTGGRCTCTHAFTVTKVERFQNARLWRNYCTGRNDILDRMNQARADQKEMPKKLVDVPGMKGKIEAARILDEDMNEFYLFHGTTKNTVEIILENGFDERVAKDASLYGAGTYFADQACKSAQYAKGPGEAKCMLYCRVTMGWVHMISEKFDKRRPPVRPNTCGTPYDTVFAETGVANSSAQQHNEFVIFKSQLAYPEFIVWFTCK